MKIIVNNLATEYRDEGQGSVILMLHGWGIDLHSFDKISERLRERYRIIRVDLPGFGKSEMPDDWNLDDYINFVRDFINKLNITPSVLLGHSFGGRILIKGIGENKLEAEKIILISSAGVRRNYSRQRFYKILAKVGYLITFIPPLIFARNKIKKAFYRGIGSEYLESGNMRNIFKNVVGEDLSLFASKIDKPILLIWGENDKQTPLKDGKLLHTLIKNSKIEIIKNTGHFSFIEKPVEIVKLIEKFV